MAMVINSNIASLNAQRNLATSQNELNTSLERLSSGKRINTAADDAAGLAISNRITSQIRGLEQAIRNANDGISIIQTAEGALDATSNILQRMRELAIQSSSGTYNDANRATMQAEVAQLKEEMDRIAGSTSFNGLNILDGTITDLGLQVGDTAGQLVNFSIGEITTSKLGVAQTGGVTALGTASALSKGDLTINGVAVGASQATSDPLSFDNAAASSIAKAAAINEVSSETGVTAIVDANTVAGSAIIASQESGTVTINGVNIAIDTTNDAATTRASVVESINGFTGQTGVTAIDTGDDNLGVILQSEDGRNITISYTGLTSDGSTTGLAAAASQTTFEGGFTLVSNNNSAIEITGGDGTGTGDLANAGLVAGSYEVGVATVTSEVQTVTTSTAQTSAIAVNASEFKVADLNWQALDNQAASYAGESISLTLNGGTPASATYTTARGFSDALNALDGVSGATAETAVTLSGFTDGQSDDNATVSIAFLAEDGSTTLTRASIDLAETATDQADADGIAAALQATLRGSDSASNITVSANFTGDGSSTFTYELTITDSLGGNILTTATATSDSLDVQNTSGGLTATKATITQGGTAAALTVGVVDDNNLSYDTSVTSLTVESGGSGLLGTSSAINLYSGSKETLTIDLNGETASTTTIDSAKAIADALNGTDGVSGVVAETKVQFGNIVGGGTGTAVDLDVTLLDDSGASQTITFSVSNSAKSGDDIKTAFDNALGLYQLANSGVTFDNITSTSAGSAVSDATAFTLTDSTGGNITVALSSTNNDATDAVQVATLDSSGSVVSSASTLVNTAVGLDSYTGTGYLSTNQATFDATIETLTITTASGEVDYLGAGAPFGIDLVNSTNSVIGDGVSSVLSDGDLVINGTAIGASSSKDDTASWTDTASSDSAGSGIAVAAAINRASDATGVTATANETQVVGGNANNTTYGAGDVGTLYINGITVGSITLTGNLEDDRVTTINAINQYSGQTGVTAKDNGVSITLEAADGRNISVAIDNNAEANTVTDNTFGNAIGLSSSVAGIGEGDISSGAASFTSTYETTYSSVTLTSAANIDINGGSNGAAGATDSGFRIGEFGGGASGVFIKDVDISTFEGAQKALAAIDNALDTISDVRANLGAINNRLEFTTGNLANVVENTSAARSRIEDADFAKESAALSRAQVLQQAGTAILAQANAQPQQVLSLLQ